MWRWILVVVAAAAISVPSLAQYEDKDKDKDKTGTSSEQHRDKDKDRSKHGGGMEAQVKALDEQNRQAALKGDADFFEKHLSDNYVRIGPDGLEMTKEQFLQAHKDGKFKYETIDLKDTKIRTFGNTAVVTHEAHVKGTGPNGPIDGDYRGTWVWVKQGNDWKLVSFQSTPQKGAQAATNK